MNLTDLSQYGINFAPSAQLITEANRGALAMDAAGPLVTTGNNGVPAWLTTYIDPKVIDILIAPLKAAQIFEEVQKGSWEDSTATFVVAESTGSTAAYGDFSQNGRSGHNTNFPQRQNYGYQTNTVWGDKQLAVAGAARMNYASLQQQAAALILKKKENDIYLYGVAGLQNYGILNDPALPSTMSPGSKTAGGLTWGAGTADEIYLDFVNLYKRLLSQANGLVDEEAKMTCVLSPGVEANLTKQNTYGQVLRDRIKLAFPNVRFVTVPQYSTTSGELIQLIADNVEGQPTGHMAYSEKLRAHGVVRQASSFEEKKSGHAWGCVLYRPAFVAGMLGA